VDAVEAAVAEDDYDITAAAFRLQTAHNGICVRFKPARLAARGLGYVLAAELRACGVDLSFTPVLDLDWGRSSVIGDRSFHRDPAAVTDLAGALIEGLRNAGMVACGKHFPGHGWVEADSHVDLPIDERQFDELARDLEPYRRLALDAVMPAHVIYRQVDPRPAGFSPFWIRLLRDELRFDGVIFSDDLSMAGAGVAGGIIERCTAAWEAGCDLLLVCNSPDAVGELLANWQPAFDPLLDPLRARRVKRLFPVTTVLDWPSLQQDPAYLAGVASALRLSR
jgi:beta-N-acetylhexosaminidase